MTLIGFPFHRVGLFLRLFLVMGVTWTAEIISYYLSESFQKFFYVTDFLNLIQGFLIFALFVLKAKVKKLIMKRYVNFLALWRVEIGCQFLNSASFFLSIKEYAAFVIIVCLYFVSEKLSVWNTSIYTSSSNKLFFKIINFLTNNFQCL